MPDINLPGGTYGFQGNEDPSSASIHSPGIGGVGPDIGVALPISTTPTFTKPTSMTISAALESNTIQNDNDVWRGIGIGFYSAINGTFGMNGYNNFVGVVLSPIGTLQLVLDNGPTGNTKNLLESVPWSGIDGAPFSTTTMYTLTYTINTVTGGISGVTLSGSNADFSSIDNDTNGIFTDAATAYAAFTGSAHNFFQYGLLSNFQLLTGAAASAGSAWTGTNSTIWTDAGNWSGNVPGATTGTTNTDTALFNAVNATNPTPVVDLGRNLQNIMFDNSTGTFFTGSLTLGTTTGNPLLLTAGGTIQTTASVANSQAVNAPLVLEGNYTFTSGSDDQQCVAQLRRRHRSRSGQ